MLALQQPPIINLPVTVSWFVPPTKGWRMSYRLSFLIFSHCFLLPFLLSHLTTHLGPQVYRCTKNTMGNFAANEGLSTFVIVSTFKNLKMKNLSHNTSKGLVNLPFKILRISIKSIDDNNNWQTVQNLFRSLVFSDLEYKKRA